MNKILPAIACSLFFASLNFAAVAAQDVRVSEETLRLLENQGQSPVTQLVMLGTGNPNNDPDRSGPSVAIIVHDQPYIVDAGPGVIRRISQARAKGVTALANRNLTRAFLTHLHSDHTLGLPGLIYNPWTLDRTDPLELYGPPGTAAMARHLEAAYSEDIRMRIYGAEPANTTGYKVNAHDIAEPGAIYRDANVTVRAFLVPHSTWPSAFGYRFETPDKVIVISGDTTFSESLIENAEGCDILVHEVYAQAGFDQRTEDWQDYHRASHTSGIDLGRIAARVRPGLLVIYHRLLWGATDEQLLSEIRLNYDGKIVIANDLDIF